MSKQAPVVIKIGVIIENGDDPVFRRLTLDQLDVQVEELTKDSIVVGKLKCHAVLLARGETHGCIDDVTDDHDVSLYYIDSDGDKVMICDDLDVAAALQEAVPGNGRVKIFAQVTVADSKSTQTAVKTAEKGTNSIPSVTETGTSPNVVDSISDLLTCAAAAAGAGVHAAVSVPQQAKRVTKHQLKTAKKISKDSLRAAKQVSKESLRASQETIKAARNVSAKGVQAARSAGQGSLKQAGGSLRHVARVGVDTAGVVSRSVAAAMTPPTTEAPHSENPTFIHGRHTCDQCLTTPIIGTRYHAMNMPDYDLCGKCFLNYKGNEINFEEAKLDRDIPLQTRWNRKYSRLARSQGRVGPHHLSRHCGPSHPLAPPVPPREPQSPFFIPSVPGKDLALEEAIRRSLKEEAAAPEAPIVPTAPVEVECEEAVDAPVVPSAPVEEPEIEVSPALPTAPVEETTTEESQEEVVPMDAAGGVDNVVEKAQEIVREVADKVEEIVQSIESDVVDKVEENVQESSDQNISYASEASGSGETAEFVAETLERMAEAIDSLNSEFESAAAGATIVDGEDDNASNDDSWSVVVDEENSHDDNIARAAAGLGSALFNSDNNVSALTGSDFRSATGSSSSSESEVSSATSVPTTVQSLNINQMQLERWSTQLEQLHELGFKNDALSIETLEKLTAANIGVGSDEEVSVTQVVDELMHDW